MEGICYADCWREERFADKVQRVVSSLEKETEWVAPKWRVITGQQERWELSRKEMEEALVEKMREVFGHEDVSNAF